VTADRAAVVATALLQILQTVPPQDRRREFEALLRQEFADERCTVLADRELPDA
jgi:hypothetical protein